MSRKLKGIRRRRGGWRVTVRVRGHLYTKQFPIDKPIPEMRAWREQQIDLHGGRQRLSGSLRGDVETFLAKPEIAAQPYVGQTAAHLKLWIAALGGDRPRVDVTRDEIEAVLQRWLKTLAEPTVYHRRSALLSVFATLDGAGAANPVKDTTCPKSWIPRDQSVPFPTLLRILAAMPDARFVKKGVRQPSAAKLVAAVLLHTGWRGVDLLAVRRSHVHWAAASVEMPASDKGEGAPPWTSQLTPDGLEALRAFDAAHLYGAFSESAVSHSFKRAARRVEGPDTPIHLYSLRHSVGADVHRETRDLATVGRLLGHVPGSRATAQYAIGANAEVDRAAVAALGAARAVPPAANSLPAQLPASTKRRTLKQLRRRA
jgi:integrase